MMQTPKLTGQKDLPKYANPEMFEDGDCVNGVRSAEEKATGIDPAPCHCFSCFTGPDCATEDKECLVVVDTAEADMNRKWFEASGVWVHINAGFNMPYRNGDIRIEHDKLSKVNELAQVIDSRLRMLHDISDNVPGGTGAYNDLLLGAGATQLLSAAIYAFATEQGGDCVTTAQRPHWGPFKSRLVPAGSGTRWVEEEDATDGCSIELVTVPTNPDNKPANPLNWTKDRVYDLVYNWPAYGPLALTSKDKPLPVVIFSGGKIFGHAPSRFGWAFVQDPKIAKHMYEYIWNNGRCSSDAQYRHSLTLQEILHRSATGKSPFMQMVRDRLVMRYEQLAKVLALGGTFTIATYGWPAGTGLQAVPDKETIKTSLATPLVAWLKSPEGTNCADLMTNLKIAVDGGEHFYVSEEFCRITVGGEEAVWDLVIKRLAGAVWSKLKSLKIPRAPRPSADLGKP